MMEQLRECAICGVTLYYANPKAELCDEHLPFGGLRLLVQRGAKRYNDFCGAPYFDDVMLTTPKEELRRRGFFVSERGYVVEADDLARHRWLMWDHGYRGEDERGQAA